MDNSRMIELDLSHLWHPCSQMRDYQDFPPLPIASAEGPWLITTDGHRIIDAISSWWCKSLGHRHPRIRAAVDRQLDRFEHIILANTTSETIALLASKLAEVCPGLDRVFFADNGSTAVEIALKMSLQYQLQTGHGEKNRFLALHNGYHGETILTLAAGDCEMYSQPYRSVLPSIAKSPPLTYVSGPQDPAWEHYPEESWLAIEAALAPLADQLAAIIFEPIIQGAGGMMIYSPDLLRRFRRWADLHGVQLIADEIMTGFGRCGRMMACEYAGIAPDYACFSKGLTAGWGPMAAVVTSTQVYEAFYDDYFSGKAFLHSNTYTGYPVAAAAALATMEVYAEEKIIERMPERSAGLLERMKRVAVATGALTNVRGIGFIAAADLVNPTDGSPFDRKLRTGYRCYQQAIGLGALLRPLGDTIYFLPPLNCSEDVLDRLAEITVEAINITLKKQT